MITPTPTATSASAELAGSTRVPKQTLGQEDFLRLLSVQLAKQDPTQPVESADFMAQMAQFSSLEQTSQLATDIRAMRLDGQFQAAASLLDREVTVLDPQGEPFVGVVKSVEPSPDGPLLEIGDRYFPFSAVVRVAPPSVPSTAS